MKINTNNRILPTFWKTFTVDILTSDEKTTRRKKANKFCNS